MSANATSRRLLRSGALALSITLALAGSAWAIRKDVRPQWADFRARPDPTNGHSPLAATRPWQTSAQSRTRARRPTTTVTNCNDSGAGSLRDAVDNAVTGEVVDLSHLTCSTITLTSGAIQVHVPEIDLYGPGPANLTIDGGSNGYNGVIVDSIDYSTNLFIDLLTIANGRVVGINPGGACVHSVGNVTLTDTVIRNCVVVADKGSTFGYAGGVFSYNRLAVAYSVITGNFVLAVNGDATGGGVEGGRGLEIKYSTVSNNAVRSYYGIAIGGGARSRGLQNVYIIYSTIDNNYAQSAAAIWIDNYGGSTTIVNSTISGNRSNGTAGLVDYQPLSIWNSTIAFNRSAGAAAAGVFTFKVNARSSILADNTANGSTIRPYDIGAFSITGEKNLITGAVSIPGDTLTACPKLGPLANNGAKVRTHALAHDSPAIDAGDNTQDLSFDERGRTFAFVRTFGASTDIGAFEWQGESDDRMFLGEFENRCQ